MLGTDEQDQDSLQQRSPMTGRKTQSVATDPVFLEELSDYLEVLSNPVRLNILKFIEHESRELTAIAEHIGMTYQNPKKHMDRLITTGLVIRAAGFGRETDRGIAPVWKYSLAPGGLENLTKTLGIFSSIAVPLGYSDIQQRILVVRSELRKAALPSGPVLYLIGGAADGKSYFLRKDLIAMGREDPDHPFSGTQEAIILPDDYQAVTRVSKPHAFLIRTAASWQVEDNASTGGTYVNSRRLEPLKKTALAHGDVIDLSIGAHAARFLCILDE
jgi:DNA-binding transcriptional ArsR family regulator